MMYGLNVANHNQDSTPIANIVRADLYGNSATDSLQIVETFCLGLPFFVRVYLQELTWTNDVYCCLHSFQMRTCLIC